MRQDQLRNRLRLSALRRRFPLGALCRSRDALGNPVIITVISHDADALQQPSVWVLVSGPGHDPGASVRATVGGTLVRNSKPLHG